MSTYRVNGVDFPIDPSEAQWMPRKGLGLDGFNRTIYEPVRSFSMTFDGLSQDQYTALRNFWALMLTYTTVSVDLPQFDSTVWQFKTYSGCVIDEPANGLFMSQFQTSVKLMIRNIVV